MKSVFAAIAAVLCCVLVFSAPTVAVRCLDTRAPVSVQDAPPQSVKVGVVAPYVEINTESSTGSGVWVSNNRILTARHVVMNPYLPDPAGRIFVNVVKTDGERIEKRIYRAVVIASGGRECDLALLEIRRGADPIDHETARVDWNVFPNVGEDCWYVGTPRGEHGCVERSIVSIPRTIIDGAGYSVVNGNADYGNSGGPLYVKRYGVFYLVGICSQFFTRSERAPVAFVHTREVYSFLSKRASVFKGDWK